MPRRTLHLASSFAVGLLGLSAQALAPDAGHQARPAPRGAAVVLDAEGIRAVLAQHLPEMQACYEPLLVDGGRAEGTVVARFTVTARGTVREASVVEQGQSLRSDEVCRCLEQQLLGMSFPRPADGEEQPVETPINLKAVE